MSDEKLDIDDFDFFEGQEEVYEYVSMTDEDGIEEEFVIVDGIEEDNVRYLLLVKADEFDTDEPEAYIFKEIEVNKDECTYEPVEDDDEYNRILILLQDEDSDYEMKF